MACRAQGNGEAGCPPPPRVLGASGCRRSSAVHTPEPPVSTLGPGAVGVVQEEKSGSPPSSVLTSELMWLGTKFSRGTFSALYCQTFPPLGWIQSQPEMQFRQPLCGPAWTGESRNFLSLSFLAG